MNDRPALALMLAGCVLLTGCSSLLTRDYTTVTLHSAAPKVESDQLTIRVETYQDLVNALLYFITQGRETGTIRLYNYPYDVEKDIEAACREVSVEDPLGAYAVSSIEYSVVPVVSCYEATLELNYRRSHEQVENLINLSGSSAIRSHLQTVLSRFGTYTAIRVSNFNESQDEAYIEQLFRQAYYASPDVALGMPDVTVQLYPNTGRQRIVEVRLNYPLSSTLLEQRKTELEHQTGQLLGKLRSGQGDIGLLSIRRAILDQSQYDAQGGSTAYHALTHKKTNSQGLALAMSLLCQRLGYDCQIVEGSLGSERHYWNIVSAQDGSRHLDLSMQELPEDASPFLTDTALSEADYHWDREIYPHCGEALPEQNF